MNKETNKEMNKEMNKETTSHTCFFCPVQHVQLHFNVQSSNKTTEFQTDNKFQWNWK